MHIQNLEVGLRRALKAQFIAAGLSNAAAEAKVTANLASAETLFHTKCAAANTSENEAKAAMRAVAAWARTI